MRHTIAEALNAMRGLHDADAGRLRGVSLRYGRLDRSRLASTPQPWRDQLQHAINARTGGTWTPDTPEYLVFSDNVVVAVFTVAARLVLPDYPLSTLQLKHRTAAVEALSDLLRHTLCDLADRRAAADGRDHIASAEYDEHPHGALRVAAIGDLSDTRWVCIGADLDAARRCIAHTIRADADQVVIISANGYGAYGHNRHRLGLDILCAIHQVADKHQVSLCTVGNWLHAEGATTADLSPQAIIAQFADAYIGPFARELDYTAHHMAELGWTQALQSAGIPENYLDTEAINRDWFHRQVRHVDSGTHGRTEVFHRRGQH